MEALRKIDPAHALCFSGHRPERLPGKGDPAVPETQPLIAVFERGKTVVLQGCMCGWDIFASEQVIALKEQHPHIKLVSVAPYKAEFLAVKHAGHRNG